MPVPLGPPAQTPCLIYLCIYPLPLQSQHRTPEHSKGSTWNEGEKEGGRREGEVGRGGEKEGEKG